MIFSSDMIGLNWDVFGYSQICMYAFMTDNYIYVCLIYFHTHTHLYIYMQYICMFIRYIGIKVPGPFDVWFDFNSAIEVSFKQAWKEQLEWILARTQFTGLIRYTPTPSRNSNYSHTDLLQTRSSYSTTLTQVQTSSTAWCCFAEVPKKKTTIFWYNLGFFTSRTHQLPSLTLTAKRPWK